MTQTYVGYGTKVLDSTGKEIGGVVSANVHVEMNEGVTVTLKFFVQEVVLTDTHKIIKVITK